MAVLVATTPSERAVLRLIALVIAVAATAAILLRAYTYIHIASLPFPHPAEDAGELGSLAVVDGAAGLSELLATLPPDMPQVAPVRTRKAVFLRAMLPLVLRVNDSILADRRRLVALQTRSATDGPLTDEDTAWLAVLGRRYGVRDGSIAELLRRVDVIPPSLALAQAAIESGWGTSRFALTGNALFGQWTFSSGGGLVPGGRDEGQVYEIRAFDRLIDAVASYARNLNRHAAYGDFRQLRAELREWGVVIDGYALAGTMSNYSVRREQYVAEVQAIIRVNRLGRLDGAQLGAGEAKVVVPQA